MRKFTVKTENKLYEDLSFEQSYELFNKLNAQGVRATCYPEAEEYKAP